MLARSRREKMPDYVAPKIQNVVGTINLGCPLVLE